MSRWKMDQAPNSSENQEYSSICISSISSQNIFIAWFSVYLLFLPLFLFILCIAYNKWKNPQSSASGGLSHSDVFTLHMVAMEMICVVGSCFSLYGFGKSNNRALNFGGNGIITTVSGQTLFHSLTCVERYLAVVHPVTYLRLRGERGVTVRNISLALVWALTAGYSVPIIFISDTVVYGTLTFIVSAASLPLVAYCSIYVLCVLTRPKPGEHQKQIDQSKRTTIYTMSAILGALLLRLMVLVVNCSILFWFRSYIDACVVMTSVLWPALPSSLVLPLLFLHRSGKLAGSRKTGQK